MSLRRRDLFLLRLALDEVLPEDMRLGNMLGHDLGVLELVANNGVDTIALDNLVVLQQC